MNTFQKLEEFTNPNHLGIKAAGIAVQALDTGRVLMLQRALTPEDSASGKWEFPGGTVEDNETPDEAAVREWSEETGSNLPTGKFGPSWNDPNGVYQGFIYYTPREDFLQINLDHEDRHVLNPDDPDGDQIETIAWFSPEDLPNNPALRDELRDTDWTIFDREEPTLTSNSFTALANYCKDNENCDGHLGLPRKDMPQIENKKLEQFLTALEDQGIRYKEEEVDPQTLTPSQKHIDSNKVANLEDSPQQKPILISRDNYILDGHHSWAANQATPVKVIRIDLPIKLLLEVANNILASGEGNPYHDEKGRFAEGPGEQGDEAQSEGVNYSALAPQKFSKDLRDQTIAQLDNPRLTTVIDQWQHGADKLARQDPTLITAIHNAQPNSPILYRGIVDKAGGIKAIMNKYKDNTEITMDPSSFSSSYGVAKVFTLGGETEPEKGTSVVFGILAGSRALPIQNFASTSSFHSEKEFITGGKFKVIGADRNPDTGGVLVTLKQLEAVR